MIDRRDLFKSTVLLAGLGFGSVAKSLAQDEKSTSPFPAATNRLDQGPFGIEQDEGWRTILYTTPSEKPVRNPGLGLVGYIWEENGPSIAARQGRETIELTSLSIGSARANFEGRIDSVIPLNASYVLKADSLKLGELFPSRVVRAAGRLINWSSMALPMASLLHRASAREFFRATDRCKTFRIAISI